MEPSSETDSDTLVPPNDKTKTNDLGQPKVPPNPVVALEDIMKLKGEPMESSIVPGDSDDVTKTTLVVTKATIKVEEGINGHGGEVVTRKRAASTTAVDAPKRKVVRSKSPSSDTSAFAVLEDDGKHDQYCWACHKTEVHFGCRVCPRAYHAKCIQLDLNEIKVDQGTCICPECVLVMKAENVNHRSDAMQLLSLDQLSNLLKFICTRMRGTPGVEPFLKAVSPEDAEDYFEFVKYPMDIAKLEGNIKDRQYGSTEGFLADVQWIVHNSIIFNSASSPYTAAAKRLLKVCRQELGEIETCPECYANAHTKENWFVEACKRPHILVWAKLKGYPYWPAKAMKIKDDQVDVRFFGQHDRAWLNVNDCYLYSIEQPNAAPKKTSSFASAVEELNQHLAKLRSAFGEVKLAEGKVVMDNFLGVEQIQRFLPKYLPQEPSSPQSPFKPSAPLKTPVVMTISSIKTSPTVVSNSAIPPVTMTMTPKTEPGSDNSSDSATGSGTGSDSELEEEADDPIPGSVKVDPPTLKTDPVPTIEPGEGDGSEVAEEEADPQSSTRTNEEKPSDELTKDKERSPLASSAFLESALGLRRVVKLGRDDDKDSGGPTTRRLSNGSGSDPSGDVEESQLIRIKPEFSVKTKPSNSKAQDLMEQISSQAQTKPGYRFNISKDISISAIDTEEPAGGGSGGGQEGEPKAQLNNGGTTTTGNKEIRRIITTGGKVRIVRSVGGKVVNKLGFHQGQQVKGQGQRIQIVSKNPTSNSGLRLIRPMGQKSTTSLRPTSTKSEVPLSTSSIQSHSGAITLPGGTITVTPLAPLLATIPVTSSIPSVTLNGKQAGSTNGLPALVPTKSTFGPTTVVRRTGVVTLPNTVATHMQQCSQGINDLLRTTVEQIAFDILDGGANSKLDAVAVQKEKEGLVVKHAKEMADLRHSHEIAMRELRVSLENEKRRSIVEAKRLCEQDKVSVIEETKKKQWCARCLREAQFYCCWNTSYCGYHCQEQHWPQHMNVCNQNKAAAENCDEDEAEGIEEN